MELQALFGDKRSNYLATVSVYNKNHAKHLPNIFYEKLLDYMELVLDNKQNKVEAYTNYLDKSAADKSKLILSCFDKNHELAGITQLKYIDTFNKKCEMGGTWFGRQFQGSGINKACKQIIFYFVFEKLQFRRLQFSIDVDNLASIKSMKRIGAKQEGLFRKNWVDSKGKSRDDLYFSITDDDWKELKNTVYKDFYK